jgi:hypothetical protein
VITLSGVGGGGSHGDGEIDLDGDGDEQWGLPLASAAHEIGPSRVVGESCSMTIVGFHLGLWGVL